MKVTSTYQLVPCLFAGELLTPQVENKLQLRAEKLLDVICGGVFGVFFSVEQMNEQIERPAFCGGDDNVYCCLETTIMELYDLTSHNYHDLNKKPQTWRQINATLEISGKMLSSIVA